VEILRPAESDSQASLGATQQSREASNRSARLLVWNDLSSVAGDGCLSSQVPGIVPEQNRGTRRSRLLLPEPSGSLSASWCAQIGKPARILYSCSGPKAAVSSARAPACSLFLVIVGQTICTLHVPRMAG
jgi:hypothetical protein